MDKDTMEKSMTMPKEGVFTKIKKFFKGLFSNNKKQEANVSSTSKIEEKKSGIFTQSLKENSEKRKAMLELKAAFERGEVAESELTEEQKIEINKLYDEQIQELDRQIQETQRKLDEKLILLNKHYNQPLDLKNE